MKNNEKVYIPNIMIYGSYFEDFEEMSDEQVGKFIKGLGNLLIGEKVKYDDPIVQGYWLGKKRDFDEFQKNYETKVETNRGNGKKGGRPKKTQSVLEETQKTQSVLEKPNITQHNPQNHKDIDKVKDKVKIESNITTNRTSSENLDEWELWDDDKFYNKYLIDIHHIMDTTKISKKDAIELQRMVLGEEKKEKIINKEMASVFN